jgi:hypothetical protein
MQGNRIDSDSMTSRWFRSARCRGARLAPALFVLLMAPSTAFAQAAHERRDVHAHASPQTVPFKHSSGGYSLEHPADWQAHQRGDRTNIGAEDGLVAGERGFRTIYGIIVQVADNPLPAGADRSLEAATRAVVEAVLKRNPHQTLKTPVHADGTVGGAPAFSAVLMGTSPVTGRGERAEIVCREYGSTQLLSLILVSPSDDFSTLEAPLRRVRDSVRIGK